MTEQQVAEPATKSSEERRALLAAKIQDRVVNGGWRIENQSDYQATMIEGKKVNHVLHLILSIVTVGLWLVVWIIMAIVGGEKRHFVAVDEFGNVTTQKAAPATV